MKMLIYYLLLVSLAPLLYFSVHAVTSESSISGLSCSLMSKQCFLHLLHCHQAMYQFHLVLYLWPFSMLFRSCVMSRKLY